MTIESCMEAIKAQQDYTKPENQRIVSAANRFIDGVIVMGVRHCCPQMILQAKMMGYGIEAVAKSEQGFIDNYNNFLTRKEAYKIAKDKGQYKPWGTHIEGVLFSEDLY